MKLQIHNISRVVIAGLLRPGLLVKAAFLNVLVGSFLVFVTYSVMIANTGDATGLQEFILFLLWFTPANLYLLYNFIDLRMYACSTYVELTNNGLVVSSKTIKQNFSSTISFENLSGVTVAQSFTNKVFGIAAIVVNSESGEGFSPWGFKYDEAEKFSQKVLEKHRVLFRQVRK